MPRINKKIAIKIFASLALLSVVVGIFFTISQNAHAAISVTPAGTIVGAGGVAAPGAGGIGAKAGAIGLSFLGKAGETATWGLAIYGLLQVLFHLLLWFISYGYGLLNSAVNLALSAQWFQLPAVLTGWTLVRDFVNVWFILILLFIAIATILRLESYSARNVS